ncbi:MAG: nucleotidyl transferase AbiEii/AbiGii toxin family protein [Candidatus Komeilibacteria bacterium]|nr:nucleotidyl transferase AbiEii/AbiGii toxin family protein [Candidatus Komeilibacteria bacterium]
MALDYPKHKNILLQILKDIFSDTLLAPYLGFKGGTAALMFYGLTRDSVDLDFDLLDESKEQEVFEKIQTMAENYGKIMDSRIKRFNLVTVVSYDLKSQNIKIEVNRRSFGSQYEVKTYLGISMLVMVKEDMFANKLMAMFERVHKTSRDIYDVYFFFKNNWPINKQLVEDRAKMPYKKFLAECVRLLEKMDNRHILTGLGEILSQPQKDWAKAKLLPETIFLLKLALDNEK